MALLRFKYSLQSTFSRPVIRHAFKVRALPVSSPGQSVIHSRIVVPNCESLKAVDSFGNAVCYGLIEQPHSDFRVDSEGLVDISEAFSPSCATDDIFLMPTSLTAFDDLITDLAAGADASDIMHRVHNWLEYKRFVTDNSTSAIKVAEMHCGVCQDFAHLMIAACKSRGIRARYVNGLMVGEGTTHAWVEVVNDGLWVGLDPTLDRAVNSEYIKFAHGRDVNDCPTNRGAFCGWAYETMTIEAKVVLE